MNPLFLRPIVQDDIKAARHRNNQLMQRFVGVTAPLSAAGDVVEIENPLNCEWDMPLAFNKGQVPTRIGDLGKINNLAVGETRARWFNLRNCNCRHSGDLCDFRLPPGGQPSYT